MLEEVEPPIADETESSDARRRIEEGLEELLDKDTLRVLMAEVLQIKKPARGWCRKCQASVHVEIPDAKSVVSAMGDLLTQAKGRPGESKGDGQTVVRLVYEIPAD